MNKFYGLADKTAHLLENEFLSDPALWRKFVDVFRSQPDGNKRIWCGEYWGKMMRGAALVCDYTGSDDLYAILTDSVRDMLTVADADGRVSSYTRETEFCGWDIWSRKYVILGMQYYLDICRDESLRSEIITFISRLTDYILLHIGEGKLSITAASNAWYGANSSSILEPVVRLYRLTGEKKYLDFATHIVSEGGAAGINFFELAYENRLYPYQYGISKAYEITSCFEGLLEYYYATGIEKYKTAVINYAKAILDSEMSIIGCCGITHELFDHTKTRQTVRGNDVKQETCVTVTVMKFFLRVLELTDDSAFADAVEQSFYNAYLGAVNVEKRESACLHDRYPDIKVKNTILPFDSYNPLTPARRGEKVGGGLLLPDLSYYGCCACIGAAGVGVFLKNAVTYKDNTVTVNFYERGVAELDIDGARVAVKVDTDYPLDGNIKVNVSSSSPVEFTLRLRNPGWANMPMGYTVYQKTWQNDTVELKLDMPLVHHYPLHWEEDIIYAETSMVESKYLAALPITAKHLDEEDHFVAVTRGPLVMAADSRTGKNADSVFDVPHTAESCEPIITDGVECLLKLKLTPTSSEPFYLVDYASAGKDWQTVIAAWLPTK